MEFFGTLSLENNGGFTSIRARSGNLALKQDDVIVARIKGDGREYTINLYSQKNRYSYRQSFKTKKDEWIKVGKSCGEMFKVLCEGTYQHYNQGQC